MLWIAVVCAALAAGAEPELKTEDVAFTAECDGSTQRYVVVFPEGFKADEPHDMLIALHGHGSDRWQFVRDDRSSPRAARAAMRKYGMLYVSPDYRAKTSWMGPKAEADLLQIIKEVKGKYTIRHTFFVGGSMGASSALSFTAMHPELVDGVAAMNGTANHLEYENFQDAIRESFGGTKQEIPLEYKKRSAEYWPEQFTMPVAVTTSGKDTSVPPESVMRLVDVLKKTGREVLHIHRPDEGHRTSLEDATASVEYVIQRVHGEQ